MKKTLVSLFTLVALAVSIQVASAGPCPDPCNPCAQQAPCACPCPCPAAPACDPCCNIPDPQCKCTWWKIFENKCCCYKSNNDCNSCYSAKRCHWWKFWTDRCVVKNNQCNKCNSCCD